MSEPKFELKPEPLRGTRPLFVAYNCSDCQLQFYIPIDAPKHMDGLSEDMLSCPWCDSNCWPAVAGHMLEL